MDGLAREAEAFLLHKAGHRLPVLMRVSPLRDEQGEIRGALEVFADKSVRLETQQRLAMLDPLPNRRYLERQLDARLAENQLPGLAPFGVIFKMDLDHFKSINDRLGHQAGDELLMMISRALELDSRSLDLMGRWGGEEFLAIITQRGLGGPHAGGRALPRPCGQLRQLPLRRPPARHHISRGPPPPAIGDSVDTLLARADQFIYQSKQNSRDRLTIG